MYIVIKRGSHQYRVKPGQFFRMEKLELSPGDIWQCQEVLAFQDKEGQLSLGKPYVDKAALHARVIRHGKGKKDLIFKKKRRKGYRRTKGHRQEFTELYVETFYSPSGEKVEQKLKKAKKSTSSDASSGSNDSTKSDSAKSKEPVKTKETVQGKKPVKVADAKKTVKKEKKDSLADSKRVKSSESMASKKEKQ